MFDFDFVSEIIRFQNSLRVIRIYVCRVCKRSLLLLLRNCYYFVDTQFSIVYPESRIRWYNPLLFYITVSYILITGFSIEEQKKNRKKFLGKWFFSTAATRLWNLLYFRFFFLFHKELPPVIREHPVYFIAM